MAENRNKTSAAGLRSTRCYAKLPPYFGVVDGNIIPVLYHVLQFQLSYSIHLSNVVTFES